MDSDNTTHEPEPQMDSEDGMPMGSFAIGNLDVIEGAGTLDDYEEMDGDEDEEAATAEKEAADPETALVEGEDWALRAMDENVEEDGWEAEGDLP